MEYCIGIDAGTTNLKVILFDLKGDIISSASCPTPVLTDGDFHYFLPDKIWEVVSSLIKRVTLGIKGRVVSIAVASVAESVVPIGINGEILFPAIAWYDERTKEQMEWVLNRIDPQSIYSITGLRPLPIYSINKILWMKKYKEDIYNNVRVWLPISDFIAYKLSGEIATDYSQASRFMAFDLNMLDWSDKILKAVEIPKETLPKPLPSGEILGSVKDAYNLGLGSETLVATGGHDHVCGAFIAGCFKKGILLDSMGTAESFQISTEVPPLNLDIEEGPNIVVGSHVVKDKYSIHLGLPFSGGLIEWTTKLMQALNGPKDIDNNLLDKFSSLAENSPSGSNGFFCLPHLFGSSVPIRDPEVRGAFLGLRKSHTPNDIARGILEGLSFEARLVLSILEQFEPIEKIIGIGGGAKNLIWLKIKSTIVNRVIEIPKVTEGTAMGAAFLGVLGTGLFKDEDEVLNMTYKVSTVIEPDRERSPLYEELFEKIYTRLFYVLRDLNHIIEAEVKTYGSNT